MLLVDGGRVCAALDVLSKTISFAGREWAASGLSTVVTDASLRRRGYGRRLVEVARDRIAASGADVGLFTCDAPLRRFYESAGWEILPGTVLVGGTEAAPFPSDRFDKVTFGGFFTPGALAAREDFRRRPDPALPGRDRQALVAVPEPARRPRWGSTAPSAPAGRTRWRLPRRPRRRSSESSGR